VLWVGSNKTPALLFVLPQNDTPTPNLHILELHYLQMLDIPPVRGDRFPRLWPQLLSVQWKAQVLFSAHLEKLIDVKFRQPAISSAQSLSLLLDVEDELFGGMLAIIYVLYLSTVNTKKRIKNISCNPS